MTTATPTRPLSLHTLTAGFAMITTPGGPPGLEVRSRPGLSLHRVGLRPLAWAEAGPVEQVFAGLSAHSRRMRFLAAVPYMHPAVLRELTYVDHDRHGAWLVTSSGEPVGIGRYIRSAVDPAVAEVAFEVVDACQGRGLGRLLLDAVGAAAADVGVTRLMWLMDAENERVQRLAVPLGGRFTEEYGTLEAITPLPDVPVRDAASIVRCARAARTLAARAMEARDVAAADGARTDADAARLRSCGRACAGR